MQQPLLRIGGIGAGIVILALALALPARAADTSIAWQGVGAGGAGTLWDSAANWNPAGPFSITTDLDFSTITSTGPVRFTLAAATSGTVNVGALKFGTTSSTITGAEYITLNGNGTAGQTILNLGSGGTSGGIYLPSTAGSIVTLGGDLTLNLTNGYHAISYQANSNVTALPGVLPVLVINSLITGGGNGALLYDVLTSPGTVGSAAPAFVLTNNSNTFDGTLTVAGMVSYTSINNTGTGAGTSSVGQSNLSTGQIGFGNGGAFTYIGSGDQTTNRSINVTTGSLNNYASSPSNLTLNGTFTGGTGTLTFGVSSGNTITVASALAGGSGLTKGGGGSYFDANGSYRQANGYGTLILTGANTYTGTTTVNGGAVQVGSGGAASTGSLNGTTGTALTFGQGAGTFQVNEASGVSQGMGTLTFNSGDGTVKSTNNGGTGTVTFSSLAARATGATGNFVTVNGVNGSTNKIVLTGQTAGAALGAGYFFDGGLAGASYAYVDAAGYVRGINYGTDASTQNDTTGAAFTGGDNIEVSGANVAGVGTLTIGTLQIADASTVTQTGATTLTVGGILKTGGNASTISGGILTSSGADLVIRVDQAADSLTISDNLTSTAALVKSGAGTLKLTGATSYHGLYLDGGTLQLAGNITGGYSLYFNGGTLEWLSGTTSSNTTVNLNSAATIQSDTGTLTFSNTVNLSNGGQNTLTVQGSGNTVLSGVVSGTGGAIVKAGSGTLTLSNADTYTGPTTVNGGTLALNGGSLGASTVTVAGGGTLSATGTASVSGATTVASGGILLAGTTTGTTLTFHNALAMASGSTLAFTLGSGNASSVLALSGGNAYSFSSGMAVDLLNIQNGTYTLITGLAADLGTEGSWQLTADDAGYSAIFSYSGGNITAQVTQVPEPKTLFLALAGLAVLLLGKALGHSRLSAACRPGWTRAG